MLTGALLVLPLIDLLWLAWYDSQQDSQVDVGLSEIFLSSEIFQVEKVHYVADAVKVITFSAVLGLQHLCQVSHTAVGNPSKEKKYKMNRNFNLKCGGGSQY